MLPTDARIVRLRRGAILHVRVPNSKSGLPAGVHPAIMIDDDKAIQEVKADIEAGSEPPPQFFVVVISHNTTIAPDSLLDLSPRLKRAGLSGKIQCDFVVPVSLEDIEDIDHRRFFETELTDVHAKERECFEKRLRSQAARPKRPKQ